MRKILINMQWSTPSANRQLPRNQQALIASAVLLAHGLGMWLMLAGMQAPVLHMASQSLSVSWAEAEAAHPSPTPAAAPAQARPVPQPVKQRVAERRAQPDATPPVVTSVAASPAPESVVPTPTPPAPQPVSRSEAVAAPATPNASPVAAAPAEPAEVQLKELSVRDQARPQYPALSRKLGESGMVQLRLLVAASGKVAQVQLKRSSGFPRLDESAVTAARQWLFSPPSRLGVAQSVWVVVPISFGLEG